MGRTSVLPAGTVPRRLGRLSETEHRVWRAFPHGELVDLRTGDPEADDPERADVWTADRTVRAEVVAALLLGACSASVGAVAAVRVAGARVTGELRVDHGRVSSLLQLRQCRFDAAVDMEGAVTESVDLSGSRLLRLSAYGAHIRGTLDLRDTVVAGPGRSVHADGLRVDGSLFASRARVSGSFCLINAQITGQVTLADAVIGHTNTSGKSLNAGGMHVGRSLLAQRLRAQGELRLPGARIGSSLLLAGATLDGLGGTALYGDALTVAGDTRLWPDGSRDGRPFSARGQVRLPGAKFGNGLDLSGARLEPAPGHGVALHAMRMSVDSALKLGDGFRADGEVHLTGSKITGHLDLVGMASPDAYLSVYSVTVEGGIRDEPGCWPKRLNLDGLKYGPFSDYRDARERLDLIRRQVTRSDTTVTGGFRAQPYEQLAAYYRSLGIDGEARTVLLAKQRATRARLPWWRRVPGHLLDVLVGYGYRPLRAIGWAAVLLVASSAYFDQVRPQHVATDDTSSFNPVLYAADHLIPVIRFGEPDVWQYHGVPEAVTVVLTVLGWTLGIAIAAAASRTLTRN
ncbi:hypothetical protein K7472_01420 [Streptomyces sp. PTM05]|uniref:Membrane-associated oxidoreductase n=1 Tax=Streptantibioticus parmotrematis TaxID=2873249 RepID=A0ABS7QJZ2_9ACTN|nr:hypothetical protein [Streptantibioticus parmotrematis]MBY8883505.1 hypothetical protein [Streptantibioticus parmotrematis]